MYSYMIDTIHTRIWDKAICDSDLPDSHHDDETTRNGIFQSTGQATFGCVCRIKLGKQCWYKIEWNTRTHSDLLTLPLELIVFVLDKFEGLDSITFCTEYKRDVHTFRCHACYQSDGPIHDWMIIDFGEHGKFPCHLALVVVVDSPEDPDEKYQLVVQSATEESKEHESTLLREWTVVSNIPSCLWKHCRGPLFCYIHNTQQFHGFGDKTMYRMGIQIRLASLLHQHT